MCLGCNPMEHDRKCRVKEMGNKLNKLPLGTAGISKALKDILVAIGQVVVQLGNAQEALEGKEKKAIEGVRKALETARAALDTAVKKGGLNDKLQEATKKLDELTNGSGALHTLVNSGNGSLQQIAAASKEHDKDYSSAKDRISEAINKVREVLRALEKEVPQVNGHEGGLLKAIEDMLDIVGSTRCVHCRDHVNKCGKTPVSRQCPECHQQYMDGTPSP